jgi:hypothetical protein
MRAVPGWLLDFVMFGLGLGVGVSWSSGEWGWSTVGWFFVSGGAMAAVLEWRRRRDRRHFANPS